VVEESVIEPSAKVIDLTEKATTNRSHGKLQNARDELFLFSTADACAGRIQSSKGLGTSVA